MDRSLLKTANRELLRAIETPPETGHEDRLDDVAAHLWTLASDGSLPADPGRLSRLQYTLTELARQAPPERAYYVSRARSLVVSYRESQAPAAAGSP